MINRLQEIYALKVLINRLLVVCWKEIQFVGKLMFTKMKQMRLKSKKVYIFQDMPPKIYRI